jgi:hypothetical protein
LRHDERTADSLCLESAEAIADAQCASS